MPCDLRDKLHTRNTEQQTIKDLTTSKFHKEISGCYFHIAQPKLMLQVTHCQEQLRMFRRLQVLFILIIYNNIYQCIM